MPQRLKIRPIRRGPEIGLDIRRQPEEHDAVDYACRIGLHCRVRVRRRPKNAAALEVDLPRVQRTDDGRAGDNAVAERAALVRTSIVGGENAVAQIEERDLAAGKHHRPPLAEGEHVE